MHIKKGLVVALLIGLGLWAASGLRESPAFQDVVAEIAQKGRAITASINQAFAKAIAPPDDIESKGPDPQSTSPTPGKSMPPFPSEIVIPKRVEPEEKSEPKILPTTIQGGMVVANDTSFVLDLNGLVAGGASQVLPKEGVQVLIIHTHSSEAYAADPMDSYNSTDKYRTEDSRYNIIRVGDELTACLESYGINVIHDRGVYDYPSYTGSYGRSGAAVSAHLKEHPEIALVLDVHRDAIGNDEVVYKTMAENGGQPSSQMMLLTGTGENGLPHPQWQENLKLALYLQGAVVDKYPTLARPVALKKERYNLQLTTGSLILEVGSNGNTLQEALCATRLFADAVAPALLKLVAK